MPSALAALYSERLRHHIVLEERFLEVRKHLVLQLLHDARSLDLVLPLVNALRLVK